MNNTKYIIYIFALKENRKSATVFQRFFKAPLLNIYLTVIYNNSVACLGAESKGDEKCVMKSGTKSVTLDGLLVLGAE